MCIGIRGNDETSQGSSGWPSLALTSATSLDAQQKNTAEGTTVQIHTSRHGAGLGLHISVHPHFLHMY